MKPNCYNRQPFKDTVTVQDGWALVGVFTERFTREPLLKTITDPMSKECQQHGPMGEATLHPDKWDCEGCKWKS